MTAALRAVRRTAGLDTYTRRTTPSASRGCFALPFDRSDPWRLRTSSEQSVDSRLRGNDGKDADD